MEAEVPELARFASQKMRTSVFPLPQIHLVFWANVERARDQGFAASKFATCKLCARLQWSLIPGSHGRSDSVTRVARAKIK